MGRMRVEVDVDYTDSISLAIETKLLINLPRPRFAVLPISLGLTIERFSGTVSDGVGQREDRTVVRLTQSSAHSSLLSFSPARHPRRSRKLGKPRLHAVDMSCISPFTLILLSMPRQPRWWDRVLNCRIFQRSSNCS